MKKIALIVLSTLFLTSCNAQTKKEFAKELTDVSKEKIQPKIDYKVNKEYDENGNLIRLDSTFSYYYSNINKDVMINDSIFKKFNDYFSINSSFNNLWFDDFFKQDDYLEEHFFKQDFFRGDFDKNQKLINKMLQRMDSLKNKFFLEQFPLEDKKKNSKDE